MPRGIPKSGKRKYNRKPKMNLGDSKIAIVQADHDSESVRSLAHSLEIQSQTTLILSQLLQSRS